MQFDTRLVSVGQEPDALTGAVVPPVYMSTTYERRVQHSPTYFYGRGESPTRERLEQCLAALEEVRFASVFASGQAASATAISLVAPGHRIVCSDDVYDGTRALMIDARRRLGVHVDVIDLTDPEATGHALSASDLAMVWIETPSNPMIKVIDVRGVADRVQDRNVLVLVDNTFATPVLQQPMQLGAHLSLYSTTKFVAGHGDVMGGALVHDDPDLDAQIRQHRLIHGNVPGALDCFLIHRGLKTMGLRVRRQAATTAAAAELLTQLPNVGTVHYPGIPDHPQYAVAKTQMASPGPILSFEYDGSVSELLKQFRLFSCAVSLGSVHSLVEVPALMTHRSLTPHERARLGITDGLVRLSIGIEDPDDVLADLRTAVLQGASGTAL